MFIQAYFFVMYVHSNHIMVVKRVPDIGNIATFLGNGSQEEVEEAGYEGEGIARFTQTSNIPRGGVKEMAGGGVERFSTALISSVILIGRGI